MAEAEQDNMDTGVAERATSLSAGAPVDPEVDTQIGDLDRGTISGAPGGTAGGVPGAGLGGSNAGATGGTVGASDMGGVTTGLTDSPDYGRMGDAGASVPVAGDAERAMDVMGPPDDGDTA